MANHTIDCKHCGADQRSVGLRCCAAAEEDEQREREAFRALQNERRQLLELHGIRVRVRPSVIPPDEWEVFADPASLCAFLASLPVPFAVPNDDYFRRDALRSDPVTGL